MTTFTSERSQLSLLRAILPTGCGRPPPGAEVHEPAALPGQNRLEVYGLTIVTVAFLVLWWGELLGSVFWALPVAVIHLHVAALLGAALGDRWTGEGRPKDEVPQSIHWVLLFAMALYAIQAPLTLSRWIAFPLSLLLYGNAVAWAARRYQAPLRIILLAHLLIPALWVLGSPWLAVLSVVTLHGLIFLDTLYPPASIFGPAQRSFPTSRREVWLTIDDGPAHDTKAVLELLRQYDAKATFFVIGQNAQARPDDVKAILANGHSIGNHTQTHPAKSFWALPSPALREEISTAQGTLEALGGERPQLFRSPVGFANPMLHALLPEQDLRLIGWTARAFDGVGEAPQKALARLKPQIRPGAIVLLHQGRPMNVALIKALLEWLHDEGFRCVIPNLFEKETARLS